MIQMLPTTILQMKHFSRNMKNLFLKELEMMSIVIQQMKKSNSLILKTDENSMIGRYTKGIEAGDMFPTLYLVSLASISGPAV